MKSKPVPIVQIGQPALRQVATPVPIDAIQSPDIQSVIATLISTLDNQADGVAIAAPQIGSSLRIFVVAAKVFYREHEPDFNQVQTPLICINPKITKTSQRTEWMEGEGCLSVRWKYGEVKRHTNVTITAYNEDGESFTRGAGGLLAHIFQHEIDHLDGVLFVDKARNVKDYPPEETEA